MREYNGGTGPLAPDIIAAAHASNGFVLELGVFTGNGSTAMIQEGLENHPDALHVSVDWEDIIEPQNRPTTPWWHFVVGDTTKAATLERVAQIAGGRKAGLIYIDTLHTRTQMQAELALWNALADNNTVWLMHDVYMYGPPNIEMVRAITEFSDANGWRYDEPRLDSHGLGRLRR